MILQYLFVRMLLYNKQAVMNVWVQWKEGEIFD